MESYIFLVFVVLLFTVVFLFYYLYIPKVNVVRTEVWPWALTPYSFWPYWFGGSGGYSTSNNTNNRIRSSARRYSSPWGGEGRVANGIHGHGGHEGGGKGHSR